MGCTSHTGDSSNFGNLSVSGFKDTEHNERVLESAKYTPPKKGIEYSVYEFLSLLLKVMY